MISNQAIQNTQQKDKKDMFSVNSYYLLFFKKYIRGKLSSEDPDKKQSELVKKLRISVYQNKELRISEQRQNIS